MPKSVRFVPAVVLMAAGGAAAQVQFVEIGVLPGGSFCIVFDVSADGEWAAGRGDGSSGVQGFRFGPGGLQGIGTLPETQFSEARAISADGGAITGASGVDNRHALRWTPKGMEDLGTLPGGIISEGRGISGDGAVITGFSTSTAGNRAFRWTTAGGMQDLGILPGAVLSIGNAVSADGGTIVGTSGTVGSPRSFRWTAGSGMQDLGVAGQANGVSADGSIIAGVSGELSFRIAGGAVQFLQPPPGYSPETAVLGISDDGQTVVGSCSTGMDSRAAMWRPNLGMVDLNTYLTGLGVSLQGWMLNSATGASADGTVLVGFGMHNNNPRAWLVRNLPDFCYPDCNADGTSTIADFGCFQTKFVATDPYADCTTDGQLTIADFGCFQTKFVAGCP